MDKNKKFKWCNDTALDYPRHEMFLSVSMARNEPGGF